MCALRLARYDGGRDAEEDASVVSGGLLELRIAIRRPSLPYGCRGDAYLVVRYSGCEVRNR